MREGGRMVRRKERRAKVVGEGGGTRVNRHDGKSLDVWKRP